MAASCHRNEYKGSNHVKFTQKSCLRQLDHAAKASIWCIGIKSTQISPIAATFNVNQDSVMPWWARGNNCFVWRSRHLVIIGQLDVDKPTVAVVAIVWKLSQIFRPMVGRQFPVDKCDLIILTKKSRFGNDDILATAERFVRCFRVEPKISTIIARKVAPDQSASLL